MPAEASTAAALAPQLERAETELSPEAAEFRGLITEGSQL